MPLARITEDDKPIVEKMILKLKSLRKREATHSKFGQPDLDDAIKSLHEYGSLKGWWEANYDL